MAAQGARASASEKRLSKASKALPDGELERLKAINMDGVFDGAEVLTNSEVQAILTKVVDGVRRFTPHHMRATLAYLEACGRFNKPLSVDAIDALRPKLYEYGLEPFECALMLNLKPDEPEIALELIPSLAHVERKAVQEAVGDVCLYVL